MSEIVVGIAQIDELEQVRSFGRRVVVPYYESIGIPNFGRDMISDYWDSELQIEAIADGRVLVACVDGEIIGVIEHDRYGDEPVIWKLYILGEHRGSGVGRRLVEAVVARLRPEDSSLLIEHAAENEAAAASPPWCGRRRPDRNPGTVQGEGDPSADASGWVHCTSVGRRVGAGPRARIAPRNLLSKHCRSRSTTS